MNDDEIAGRVTEVLHYLDNRKRRAVAGLFPDCERYYYDEWMDRNPFDFWGHLDLPHRRRLVALAHEFYQPGGDR